MKAWMMRLVFASRGRRLRRSVEVLARGVQALCRACDEGGSKLQLSFRTRHCREWAQRSPRIRRADVSQSLLWLQSCRHDEQRANLVSKGHTASRERHFDGGRS